jgi:uncharacterized DUF497 family protein
MEFEFDPAKSAANLAKHGLDFNSSKALWLDPDRMVIPTRLSGLETRYVILARISGKVWAGAYTERSGKIRIISVRRAHPDEQIAYDHQW